jgi:hypothetical protein
MTIGLPILGLATTELVTAITNGFNGFLDTDPDRLIEPMQRLVAANLEEAAQWILAADQGGPP